MKRRRNEAIDGPAQRSPRRARDVRVADRHGSEQHSKAGFTLIELVVGVATLAIAAAVASPHLPDRDYGLWSSHAQLIADLRKARADALVKGDHYLVTLTVNQTYEIVRLKDDDWDGEWTPDGSTLRTRSLSDHVTFTSSTDEEFEFNTRGLMVIPEAAAPITMRDDRTGKERTVTVWPSGQIAPTSIPELED
jgi:prepilin-type N-terminal cleavage/methylation domain-containing protein